MTEQAFNRPGPAVVGRQEWLKARRDLLAEEKKLTEQRDELSRRRRGMPWVRIDKPYRFEGPDGELSLGDLFAGRSQLIVYHLMFHPDWEWACKSCSFWADHFDGMVPHLAARDTAFAAISRAPLAKLKRQAERLGWRFPWVSARGEDFNADFGVSFPPDDDGGAYNYAPREGTDYAGAVELPGFSVFVRDPKSGAVFHSYSTYGRGIELMNSAYSALDLTPAGRNEEGLAHTMSWVRLHDDYAA
ncbi:DUF899 domain-containing protein [Chelatococcus sambhunathii]|uniref:DUF899 domain-containing protein n=1 Tax=Chelatococcus sambhunathii TaxID=363953 RepID=A0ABU1DDC8_9HYPH|nr:DUF899 domain-containing protein [Chelatococcus sambhunathii]MDR4306097.1 DUF899 domain-containing protein [Chelatococcus sambhunathii]